LFPTPGAGHRAELAEWQTSNESKTIFLLNGWEGKTPAELSILAHEMVHHLQNVGQLKFECPEEREELAYKAQESWLHLFGHDLEHDSDGLTALASLITPHFDLFA
jgi:hypothetical protein